MDSSNRCSPPQVVHKCILQVSQNRGGTGVSQRWHRTTSWRLYSGSMVKRFLHNGGQFFFSLICTRSHTYISYISNYYYFICRTCQVLVHWCHLQSCQGTLFSTSVHSQFREIQWRKLQAGINLQLFELILHYIHHSKFNWQWKCVFLIKNN